MNVKTLIIPGIGNSDQAHWQSLWQSVNPNFYRVEQRDWSHPICSEWVATLNRAVEAIDENIVLVAHSLGCLLVAHWAAQTTRKIKGALLVAPPSPNSALAVTIFDTQATGFLPIPTHPLIFPSIVVVSADDPYSNLDSAKSCAESWGSRFINIGTAGHINSNSGLGNWSEGFSLYKNLAA